MFCRNCGAKVEKNFCRNCGTPVSAKAREINRNLNNASVNNMPVNNPQFNNQVPDYNANQNYSPYNQVPQIAMRPKKKRKPVVAVIVAVIAVLAIGFAVFGKLFGTGLFMSMASPEKYYQSIEKKNLATLTAHTANIAKFTGKGGSNTKLSLSLTEDGKSLMNSMNTDWLNTMSLDINSEKDETSSYSAAVFNINDTKIIALETLAGIAGDEMLLKLPDFSPTFIKLPANSNFMDFVGSQTPDMDSLSKVLDRYGEVVIENLNKVEKSKETVTVGSTTTEYDKLVVTIDSEISHNIAKAIASQARDDRNLENLIRSSAASKGEDADAAYADFLAGLDEAESIDETAENTVLATMTLYVDKKGEVCGRHFVTANAPDTAQYYLTAWKGNNFETEAKLISDDSILNITGSGSRSGNKISGDFTLQEGDIIVSTVKVDGFDKDAAKAGKVHGSFTFTPSKDYIDESGSNPLMAGFSYKIDVASESGKLDSTVLIFNDAANMATLKISSNTQKGGGIPTVSDGEKVDYETWFNSVGMETVTEQLTNALRSAGMPEEYLN